eukprot:TRINITY_DN575_c3_g1_i2.p1 TRINITY_DN575_c3_g1~~TRINITY_DN575_c3_g1_i2.p1  ORF type:complete len:728 (+),score=149.47 TRINITY_DN575_c3_g1_i2:24-2207(+)
MSQSPYSRIRWAALSKYKKLELSADDLAELPEELQQLAPCIEKLDVSKNRLESVGCVSVLRRLTKLNMCCNRLIELPVEFADLTSLVELNLSQNSFYVFPSVILQMSWIEILFIAHNQLSMLPEGLDSMQGLVQLNVSNNLLRRLPAALGGLRLLRHLDLASNRLERLISEIGQMTALKTLLVEGNSLVDPPLAIVQRGTSEMKSYLRRTVEDAAVLDDLEEKARQIEQQAHQLNIRTQRTVNSPLRSPLKPRTPTSASTPHLYHHPHPSVTTSVTAGVTPGGSRRTVSLQSRSLMASRVASVAAIETFGRMHRGASNSALNANTGNTAIGGSGVIGSIGGVVMAKASPSAKDVEDLEFNASYLPIALGSPATRARTSPKKQQQQQQQQLASSASAVRHSPIALHRDDADDSASYFAQSQQHLLQQHRDFSPTPSSRRALSVNDLTSSTTSPSRHVSFSRRDFTPSAMSRAGLSTAAKAGVAASSSPSAAQRLRSPFRRDGGGSSLSPNRRQQQHYGQYEHRDDIQPVILSRSPMRADAHGAAVNSVIAAGNEAMQLQEQLRDLKAHKSARIAAQNENLRLRRVIKELEGELERLGAQLSEHRRRQQNLGAMFERVRFLESENERTRELLRQNDPRREIEQVEHEIVALSGSLRVQQAETSRLRAENKQMGELRSLVKRLQREYESLCFDRADTAATHRELTRLTAEADRYWTDLQWAQQELARRRS